MTDETEMGFLTIRAPKSLLRKLSAAVRAADPDVSTSATVRGLLRWYVGDGSLPKLPPSGWNTPLKANCAAEVERNTAPEGVTLE